MFHLMNNLQSKTAPDAPETSAKLQYRIKIAATEGREIYVNCLRFAMQMNSFIFATVTLNHSAMSTYTLTVNEETREGKAIISLLKSMSDIVSLKRDKNSKTTARRKSNIEKALEEVERGEVYRFKDFDEYKAFVDKL